MRRDQHLSRRPRPRARRRGSLLTLLVVTVLGLLASPAVALTGDEDDLGARALRAGTWSVPQFEAEDLTRFGPVFPRTPPMSNLYSWNPAYYGDGCHVPRRGTSVISGCLYGDRTSDVQVAMIGDSKVGQLFPALEEIAKREGWALRTYTKSACSFVDKATPDYPQCDTYNAALRKHLAQNPPDIAFVGGMRRDVGQDYVRTWRGLQQLGVKRLVAFWDTPVPNGSTTQCVADALEAQTDLTACAVDLPDEVSGNPSMRTAAAALDFADHLDLRDWVCPETQVSPLCGAVIGRAQVYAEGSHMSQGYSATLTDPIHQRLHELGVAAYRPSVDRVGGRDRYETAAKLSRDVEPGGRVFLASGRDYPDALAAAAKAGAGGGAVLLTGPNSVPAVTHDALARLRPSEIVVVGGATKVGSGVLTQLESYDARVKRVSGTDRYETAAELSRLAPVTQGGIVYVATGGGFPDALAAAAQAGKRHSPILLVRPDGIPAATAKALRELQPSRIVVAGGSLSVSSQVVRDLREFPFRPRVERRGGANRYETAAALAQGTAPGGVLHVSVATDFADALAAAPAAAASGGAVLLVTPDRVPSWTRDAVATLGPERVVLTGGRTAIKVEAERALIRLVR